MIKDSKIRSIFPSRNSLTIESRMKMFLYESDYEWAMKFCSKIINHPNYIEIKKIIGDLEIKVVREYHNLIVNRINDDLDLVLFTFLKK